MPNFITRIELREGTTADYEKLSTRLEALGFERAIRADDGRVHQLPQGEYVGSGDGTTAQVRDLAVQAAGESGRAFGIVAVEFERASWFGLTVIEQPQPAAVS